MDSLCRGIRCKTTTMYLITIICGFVYGCKTTDIRLRLVEDICKQIENQICKCEQFII